MELEALLLGLEPVAALGLGLAVIGIGAAISLLGNAEEAKKINETGRNLVKQGLKYGIDIVDKVQVNIAEVSESWNDLVAEAQAEVKASRDSQEVPELKEVTISE